MVGGAVTAAEALVISLTVGETSAGVGSTDELKTDDPSGACSLTEDLIKGLKWDDTTTELTWCNRPTIGASDEVDNRLDRDGVTAELVGDAAITTTAWDDVTAEAPWDVTGAISAGDDRNSPSPIWLDTFSEIADELGSTFMESVEKKTS